MDNLQAAALAIHTPDAASVTVDTVAVDTVAVDTVAVDTAAVDAAAVDTVADMVVNMPVCGGDEEDVAVGDAVAGRKAAYEVAGLEAA